MAALHVEIQAMVNMIVERRALKELEGNMITDLLKWRNVLKRVMI
jgi:hypothetical protein